MADTDRLPMDEMLALARESNPDLWAPVEGVAKIIDPGAFLTDCVIRPEENSQTFKARQRYMQATAMKTAHEILKYLGINTETDWLYILERLGKPEHTKTEALV